MVSRVWAIVRKELIQIRRDPRTLAIVVVMPVMQLVLFGYAINTSVEHIPMVVFDEARDGQSRGFQQALFTTGYFDLAGEVSSLDAVQGAIDSGQAKVGLVLPPRFSRDLLSGQPGQAQLLIDGSDPNTAQTALLVAGLIAQARSVELASARAPAPAIDLRPVVLYNPSMQSVNFMVPGLLGLILQFQTLILTAFAVVRERERGTLEQLIVTPIKPWELMLGKILPYVALAFVSVFLATAVGVYWFRVEFAGSFPLLIGLAAIFVLSSLGIGLLVSTVSRTQTQAMQIALFIMLPSILLSGFMFAREAMPPVIRELGLLIPLTYFLRILRGIFLKGVGLEVLWTDALPLALFGLAVFALSSLRFQKSLD
jgi:ABC-2 type transport system permease protein